MTSAVRNLLPKRGNSSRVAAGWSPAWVALADFNTTANAAHSVEVGPMYQMSSIGTALPIDTDYELVRCVPTLIDDTTSDDSRWRDQLWKKVSDRHSLLQSNIMSAIGLAALVSYAGHLAGPAHDRLTPAALRTWVDDSSVSTWNSSFPDELNQSTALTTVGQPGKTLREHVTDNGSSLEAQINNEPRYSYGRAIAYAKKMGLPTDFPL